MKKILFIISTLIFSFSCDKVKEKTKETINKSGEVVGKASTEFIEGVTEGVDRSLDCSILLSEPLIKKGVEKGKFTIHNLSEGHNNLLSLYLIFNKDVKGDIWVKVYCKKGLEVGRSMLNIEAKSNDAKYFDFNFDKRTNIEVKSLISIE